MSTAPEGLQSVFDRVFAGISQVREAFTPQLLPREVGTITSIATGIAKVSGLPGVGLEELIKFPGGVFGIAFNVGEGLVGRVIDPLGQPLDEKGPVVSSGRLPIERPAAPIMDRAAVTVPLQT